MLEKTGATEQTERKKEREMGRRDARRGPENARRDDVGSRR